MKKPYCPKKEPIYHTAVHSGGVVDTCFTYLALVCSSSDLELDHLRLEPEMKEATALFALNRLLVPREQNWVGMGSTSNAFEFLCMCACACSHMHPDTCACLRKVIWSGDWFCVSRRGSDRGDCWPTQLHVQRLLTGHLLSSLSTIVYCLAKWELYSLIKVTG